MASATIGPCRAPRGPQHIDNDDLAFNISITGGRLVQQRGREVSVRPGEAILTTAADPGVVVIPAPSRLISLRIPRLVISTRGVDLDRNLVRRIPRSAEALSLLSGYLNMIHRAGALTSPQLFDAVVAHVHDLVALALGASGDARRAAETGGMQAARLSAIFRLIERRSGDPDLSAITVAAALGSYAALRSLPARRNGTELHAPSTGAATEECRGDAARGRPAELSNCRDCARGRLQ